MVCFDLCIAVFVMFDGYVEREVCLDVYVLGFVILVWVDLIICVYVGGFLIVCEGMCFDFVYIYIYIYIYMLWCVTVCV